MKRNEMEFINLMVLLVSATCAYYQNAVVVCDCGNSLTVTAIWLINEIDTIANYTFVFDFHIVCSNPYTVILL